MPRSSMILTLLAAVALGCQTEPPAAGPVPTPTPAANADQEVLIATAPDGADVILSGAKVGTTPFRMIVRGNTNIVLEKQGFVRQAMLITPESEPNLVVELVADESAVAAEEPEAEQRGEDAAKTVSKKSDKEKAGVTEPPADAPPGDTTTKEPEPPKPESAKAKTKAYETMAELKRDLRAGLITGADYRRWQQEIREKRAAELVQLKKDLAAGKLTKAEYETKAREIKAKYEGK
jgi:hypothetical protein